MSTKLPSNVEMFGRIRQPGDVLDEYAKRYWDALVEFSKANQLLEPDFEERCAFDFHSCFWEVYLPRAFHARGIVLKRWISKQGGPDFYFEENGTKVWIEAVACGESSEKNAFSPPSDDPMDFASGIAPESKIMHRLSTAISSKLEKFEKHRKFLAAGDRYVIALNGYRAINGHLHDRVPIITPFIVRTLFGARDLVTAGGKPFYIGSSTTEAGTPLAYFFNMENKHISGIFYSATHCWETAIPPGDGCFFVQNTHAADLVAVSSRFPTWRCSTDGRIQRPEHPAP